MYHSYTAAQSLSLTMQEELIERLQDTRPYAPRTVLTITDPETGETYRLALGPAHVAYLEDLLAFGVIP
ncbi:hypothetical protein [Nonomuraea jabiensis]|uniref:Uncharacterized protein n=1 Tax=Nonomuraea jabiensis TaxID=882448 RepID=A0A7W9L7Q5_9ACTN|nr:hypothetical protein [Nonomuraea jabiensis]MBB5773669.1 hypothetical protein [Nonomuraea jabiensis]